MYTFKKIKKNKIKYFLFYDYETFGIHPALDKPSQFSCIRTDINFNIVSDPEIFYCYPPYDYLPNPDAILLTGITPNYTLLKGLNEFDFSKKINAIFSIGNTCILGYNNIHFDDEITRNIFYRNLIDPYHWSWKNGNSRWDLLNVLRTYYALRPKGIMWPRDKKNVVTFKLDKISKANGIKHESAHDATSDVYATIELIKLLQRKQPRLLNFLFKYRIKEKIISFIDIIAMKPIFYISSSFGTDRYNISLIAPILWHPKNPNILIGIDLTKNICLLLEDININNIFSMGIQLIYINRCPILIPYRYLTEDELLRIGIDYRYCYNNLLFLNENSSIKEKIQSIFSSYDYIKSKNVDLQIYDSFFSKNDQFYIKKIHKIFPVSSDILSKYTLHDKRIKKIIFRCKARNFITYLNKHEKNLWFQHCIKICNTIELNNYKYNINFLIKKHIKNKKNVFLLKEILHYINYLENAILHINHNNILN